MELRKMAAVGCGCLAVQVAAGEPSGWRNDGSGRYPSANPPTNWSAGVNVVWSAPLPSSGNAAPLVVGDRIFVGSEPTDLVCVSRTDGKILWQAANTYFEALTPDEIEKAKALQAASAAVQKEIQKLDKERKEKQKALNNITALRARITELQKKLELMATPDALAARLAELEKQAAETAKALAEKPNDRGLKRRGDDLAAELKLLCDKGLVEAEVEAAKKRLTAQAPREPELKSGVEALKQQTDDLRKNKLPPLARYDLPSTHGGNGYSTPTAVSDGKDVFVLRGIGMAACYSLDGKRKWIKFVAKSTQGWGHSASPLLVDDLCVVQMQGLTALDKETGETVWTAPEASTRFGTPVVVRVGGEAVLATPNGDFVRASDGKMLAARVAKLDYCSPVAGDGVVYFIERGGKAVKLPEEIGEQFKPEVLWTASKIPGDRYYASPVLEDGLIYAINQKSELVVIDAKTGEPVYDRKLDLGGTVYPSLTLAGKHLLASSENGTTVVFEPGREYKEVARNKLEAHRSCLVADGDRLYLRGMKQLYCLAASTP